MSQPRSDLFRPEAVERHAGGSEDAVGVRLGSAWIRRARLPLVALTAAGVLAGLFVHTDEWASGPGRVAAGGVDFGAVLPAGSEPLLAPGRTLEVELPGGGWESARLDASAVEPIDQATAIAQYGRAALADLLGSSTGLVALRAELTVPMPWGSLDHVRVRLGSEAVLPMLLSALGGGDG